MKTYKFILLICMLFSFSACTSSSEYNYVKNIYLTKEDNTFNMILDYYDFSSQEENYKQAEYTSDSLHTLGIKALKSKNYNFRLCENIFLSPQIILDNVNQAVYIINSLKISPTANILCLAGKPGEDTTNIGKMPINPAYNLNVNSSGVSTSIPVILPGGENGGNVLVINNQPVSLIDKQNMFIIDMLNNSINTGEYTFRRGKMWAKLDNVHTHFSINEKTLNINVSATLKEYKGEHHSLQTKDLFITLLSADIAEKIQSIYNNIPVDRYYNLHWYCKQNGIDCTDTKIKVNIY